MASILVAYGSGEGQTAKVARFVQDVLTDRGHEVTVRSVTDDPDLVVEDFDGVLVGSPVHNRKHLPSVVEFVQQNRDALTARPNGFFQLSLASTVPGKWARRGDEQYADTLVTKTGWQPDRVGHFAGAVKYSQYNPVERVVFKAVSAITTGDTDTSQDYEYTDWNDVEAFAVDFATDIEARGSEFAAGETRRLGVGRPARVVAGVALVAGVAALAYLLLARKTSMGEC
jgi:menaquinone-dependent protoporphyrinogen oxidase